MKSQDVKNKYNAIHFGLMNILARIFGITVSLAGLIVTLKGVGRIVGNSLAAEENIYAFFILGLLLVVIGIAFLRVKPARPDLDGYFGAPKVQPGKRSWWTGTQK